MYSRYWKHSRSTARTVNGPGGFSRLCGQLGVKLPPQNSPHLESTWITVYNNF